jgi:hypothetical protein
MKRRWFALVLTGAIATASAANATLTALTSLSRLGPTGIGAIVFGSTPAQAAAAGLRFATSVPTRGTSCRYLRPIDRAGLAFLVEDGTIRRAEMTTSALATTDGFRVGDPMPKVIAFYGHRAQIAPDKYDPAAQTIAISAKPGADPRFRMLFKARAGVVRAIFAGVAPQIDYVEGCS